MTDDTNIFFFCRKTKINNLPMRHQKMLLVNKCVKTLSNNAGWLPHTRGHLPLGSKKCNYFFDIDSREAGSLPGKPPSDY